MSATVLNDRFKEKNNDRLTDNDRRGHDGSKENHEKDRFQRQADEQKNAIIKKLGDLSGFEIAQNQALLAIYQRPEMTPGGIIATHNYLKEDIYQGKVGLVVKIGAACRFQRFDPSTGTAIGLEVNLHDWIVIRPSHSWALDVNGHPDRLLRDEFVPCRLIYDDQLVARIAHPMMVW